MGAGYGSAYGGSFDWTNAARGVDVTGISGSGIGEFIGDTLLFDPLQQYHNVLRALGEWGDIKPAVWQVPGPLESGVFDRPDPSVSDVGSAGSGSGGYATPTPVGEPEFLPGSIYESSNRPPTDWDEYYERYKVLNPEEPEVALDVGAILSGAVDIWQQQVGYGGGPPVVQQFTGVGGSVAPSPSIPSGAKVQLDPKTGKVTLCRRRRRRRLLTPTDLNDLAALKTIVGGGQAINFAVMKAVRR